MGALTKLMAETDAARLETLAEAMGSVNVPRALEALEAMKSLEGLDVKMIALGRHGMNLSDGLFWGVFTEAEESLLFELERRGYLTTGIVRLLG